MAGTCQWFQSDFLIKSIVEAFTFTESCHSFYILKENEENAWCERKKTKEINKFEPKTFSKK